MSTIIHLEEKPITYAVIETWEGFLQGINDIHSYLALSLSKGDKARLAFDIETFLDALTRMAIDAIFFAKKAKRKKKKVECELSHWDPETEEEVSCTHEPPEDSDAPDYPVPYPVKNKEGRFDARVRLLQFGFNPAIIDHQILFDLEKIYLDLHGIDEPTEKHVMLYYRMIGEYLQPIFNKAMIIGQNLKYEYAFMWKFFRCRIQTMRDLMLMAQCRYMGDKSKKHGLGDLYALNIPEELFIALSGRTHAQYKKFKEEEQKSPWWQPELSTNQHSYAAEDVRFVWPVFETLLTVCGEWAAIHGEGFFNVIKLECDLIKAVAKAEVRGFQMDLDYYWNVLKPWLVEKMEEAQAEANKLIMRKKLVKRSEGTKKDKRIWLEEIQEPYNLNSADQVVEILGELSKRLGKTKGGKPSAKADELMFLRDDHPIIKWVLQFKRAKKLIGFFEGPSGYLKHTDSDGKVHCSIHQIGQADGTVKSGRFSLSGPNLSNVPAQNSFCEKKVKELVKTAFTCPVGMNLLVHDFSQIELRIAAQLTMDEFLVACFRDGKDMHSETARTIFKLKELPKKDTPDEHWRDKGKTIRFALTFLMGEDKFMKDIFVKTEGELDYVLRGEEGREEAREVMQALENLSPRCVEKRKEIEEDVLSLPRRLHSLEHFKNGEPYYVGITTVTAPGNGLVDDYIRTRTFCLDPFKKKDAAQNPEDWHMSDRVLYAKTGKVSTWDNQFNRELRTTSREAWNNEMQSPAANLFKLSIVQFDKECEELHDQGIIDEYKEGMINFVHDEIISQFTEANTVRMSARIKEVMEEVEGRYLTAVPAEASAGVGKTWYSAK